MNVYAYQIFVPMGEQHIVAIDLFVSFNGKNENSAPFAPPMSAELLEQEAKRRGARVLYIGILFEGRFMMAQRNGEPTRRMAKLIDRLVDVVAVPDIPVVEPARRWRLPRPSLRDILLVAAFLTSILAVIS